MNALLTHLDSSIGLARAALAGTEVTAEGPTPCDGMTVPDLVNHLLSGMTWLTEMGESGASGINFRDEPTFAPSTWVATFEGLASRIAACWTDDRLADDIELPWGTDSGGSIVDWMFPEILLHGWDLSVASGSELPLPDELAAAAHASLSAKSEGLLRGPGMFGQKVEVSDEASPGVRLLGFAGRDPS